MPRRHNTFDVALLVALREEMTELLDYLGEYSPLPPGDYPGTYS